MESEDLVKAWRAIIQGDSKSWVLFEHGTCVILTQPEADLAAQATALLKEWGPVQVATPSADFNVIELAEYPGWVVTCHHPDILNYVSSDEFDSPVPGDMMVGLIGRSKRDQDAAELHVVHVEDKTGAPRRG
jgi:hypothetical protein